MIYNKGLFIVLFLLFYLFSNIEFCAGKDVVFSAPPLRYITGISQDKLGNVWVSDEENGLSKWDSQTGQWSSFNSSILKDIPLRETSFYAVGCDSENRIWVGTLRDGVLVFDGRSWERFSVEEGLPGERIFAIQVHPKRQDVWIATSGGVTCYDPQKRLWNDFTRLEKMPSDQVSSIAFDSTDHVYFGTGCHGIVKISIPKRKMIAHVRAPERFERLWPVPLSSEGNGLPSNFINNLCFISDGTLCAATSQGLVYSLNKGQKWHFIRGRNWQERVKQLYTGKQKPPLLKPQSGEIQKTLLPDDYVSAIFEGDDKTLYLATREHGVVLYKPETREMVRYFNADDPRLFFRKDSDIWVAEYSRGLRLLDTCRALEKKSVSDIQARVPPVAARLTLSESGLKKCMDRLSGSAASANCKAAEFLYQDWSTRGDWVCRYGRQYFLFCGHSQASGPTEHWLEERRFGYPYVRDFMGPHTRDDDSLRHWIHAFVSHDHRSLWSLKTGVRRQTEIDDHGEAYSSDWEGPDIWMHVEPPKADTPYRLSLYFYNKDGGYSRNRFRDYSVEIYPSRGLKVPVYDKESLKKPERIMPFLRKQAPPEIGNWVYWKRPLARTRVRDFRGGVWVSFLIRSGPCWVRVNRNYSMNTFVCGVALDTLDGKSVYKGNGYLSQLNNRYEPPLKAPVDTSISVLRAFDKSRKLLFERDGIPLYNRLRRELYRYGLKNHHDDLAIQRTLRWLSNRPNEDDRLFFEYRMRLRFYEEQSSDLYLQTAETAPHSPGTLFKTYDEAIQAELKLREARNPKEKEELLKFLRRESLLNDKAQEEYLTKQEKESKVKQQRKGMTVLPQTRRERKKK